MKLSESFIRRITIFTILFYSPLKVFLLSKYLLRSMPALESIKRLYWERIARGLKKVLFLL